MQTMHKIWNALPDHQARIFQQLIKKRRTLRTGDVHLFVCLFVCRLKRVLVGHWPAWPSSAIAAAGTHGPRVSQVFTPHDKLHPHP